MNVAAFPNRKSYSSLIFCSRVRTSSASVGSLLAKRYIGLHPPQEAYPVWSVRRLALGRGKNLPASSHANRCLSAAD
jgi:hypothetical protein